jgi:hypothetical protein
MLIICALTLCLAVQAIAETTQDSQSVKSAKYSSAQTVDIRIRGGPDLALRSLQTFSRKSQIGAQVVSDPRNVGHHQGRP